MQGLFLEAKDHIVGGVNSPVRAFGEIGVDPFFVKRAEGAYLFTEDDRRLVDYVCSWGASILGHAHDSVIRAVHEAVESGLSFGTPTSAETQLAIRIKEFFPSIERLRLVNSGTEATMSAIRLARGFTNRNLIIKFEGCYHGHSDSLLVKAGSGLLTGGISSSAGVPEDFSKNTAVLEYNNVNSLEEIFKLRGREIAAVIVEPIAGNMNMVKPSEQFITQLRSLTEKYGSILIYDEVMTGFRVAKGGAQNLQGIDPDLTTIGKIAGGGMPLAAFGGKNEIMDCLSPIGKVYQAGTLSGNPISVAAGLSTLNTITENDNFYLQIETKSLNLVNELNKLARKHNIDFVADHVGAMLGFYFLPKVPNNFDDVKRANSKNFRNFFLLMLEKGIYLAPSMFEAGFISMAHDASVIEKTLSAADYALSGL